MTVISFTKKHLFMSNNTRLISIFLVIFTFHVPSKAFNNDSWKLIKEKSGIRVYKKHIKGSSLYAFKGEGIIKAPIESVVAILLDNNNAIKWVPRLKYCTIADQDNQWPQKFVQYSVFDAPWPVKDRYFLSEVTVTINTNQSEVVISYKNINNDQHYKSIRPPLKAIRGIIDGSQYTLVKRPDGGTDFTAISIVQPNGKIPNWLINWVGKSMPFDTIKRLNKRLNDPLIIIPKAVLALFSPPPTKQRPTK